MKRSPEAQGKTLGDRDPKEHSWCNGRNTYEKLWIGACLVPMCLRSSKSQLNLQEVGDHVSLSTLELGGQAQAGASAVGEPVSSTILRAGGWHPSCQNCGDLTQGKMVKK